MRRATTELIWTDKALAPLPGDREFESWCWLPWLPVVRSTREQYWPCSRSWNTDILLPLSITVTLANRCVCGLLYAEAGGQHGRTWGSMSNFWLDVSPGRACDGFYLSWPVAMVGWGQAPSRLLVGETKVKKIWKGNLLIWATPTTGMASHLHVPTFINE